MRLSSSHTLAALPPSTLPLVEALMAAAASREQTLHLVGGPVRDLLLGRPIRDVDLLIEARNGFGAAELARAAAPRGAKVEVHDRFGTVRLTTGEASVDVAAARRERYRHPGALPKVEPASLEEDLRRRDFSVNAMALPLASRGRTTLVDPAQGRVDLEARVLRVLHDGSFHDDPTRALRAARLAPRLGFRLARSSNSALRNAMRDGAFGGVSGERLRREFEKLFEDAARDLDPAQALRRLSDWQVLAALEPGLELPRGAHLPLRRLGRALASPPWRSARFRRWAAGLYVWLAAVPANQRKRLLDRLSLRGELSRRISAFPREGLGLLEPLAAARGRGPVDAVLAGLDEERLYALHAWAPTPVRRRVVRWAAEDRARRSPVSGNDLTAIGIAGPAVGRALARIRSGFLDGAIANREEGLALAREVSRQRPPARPKRGRKRGARGRTKP